jgi:hypothetical protein
MIRKNIDIIAIGLLLGAAALYSGARQLAWIEVVPSQRVQLSRAVTVRLQRVLASSCLQRALACSRSSRALHLPSVSITATTD